MLSTKRSYRWGFALVVGAGLLAAASAGAETGEPTRVRAAPKQLAATPHAFARTPGVAQSCLLGNPSECFDVVGGLALNPASFFDRQQVSDTSHYFIKLFRNDTQDTLVVNGMGFESRSNDPGFNRFAGAGGILAGPDAVFPSPDALLNLPVPEFDAHGRDTLTCIEFPAAIDTRGTRVGPDVLLPPGEAAWLVLRFIAVQPGIFVGILVDNDGNDHPCDYMTIDGGLSWYQPDPVHGPHFDWGITAFTGSGPSAPRPPPPTWSSVKMLYIQKQ